MRRVSFGTEKGKVGNLERIGEMHAGFESPSTVRNCKRDSSNHSAIANFGYPFHIFHSQGFSGKIAKAASGKTSATTLLERKLLRCYEMLLGKRMDPWQNRDIGSTLVLYLPTTSLLRDHRMKILPKVTQSLRFQTSILRLELLASQGEYRPFQIRSHSVVHTSSFRDLQHTRQTCQP